MKKKLLGITLPILLSIVATAQSADEDSKNIVISDSKREFEFVKGNSENPVLVKEESTRTYYCNSYRASLPVAEFYNDMELIDDVNILVDNSRKHGITPTRDFYSVDGIFYSDARICYFSLPLVKKGSTSSVNIKKTTLDPHYFTSIHFMESELIQNQVISVKVPSWMKLELKEFNFAGYNIQKSVNTQGDYTVYTYSMKDIPAIKRESASPGLTYYAPHLLVMTKSADTKEGKQVYFATLKDQYAWYRKLVLAVGNDTKSVKEKAEEITAGLTTTNDKVKAVYQWIQDNIRYIAFEDGIAGFKPEKAQEVLRKKYGDCKGMANLTTEMLRSLGIDARRCWIGTRHLAYNYSTPSLSVDNHMIAAWMNAGKPVFLDATEKYIGMGEVAERIQGRETLIEDGDNYILTKVPEVTHLQNTAIEKRVLTIEGANLKGHVTQSWKGENKEWLLAGLNSIKQEKQETALKRYLSEGKTNFEVKDLKIDNLNNYNKDLKVEYDIVWKDAVTEFGAESYLEIDNRRSLESFKLDTAKRKLAYWFDFKNHLILDTEINLPANKTASELPAPFKVQREGYSFSGSYTVSAQKLNYRCEIILQQSEIRPEQFQQWNADIDQLKNFYNHQIVLTTKK